MDLDSGRVIGAVGDATRFAGELRFTLWIAQGFWAIALSGMAYIAVPTQWMIVVGVIAISSTIGAVIIPTIRRFDAGRAYVENTCHEIEALIYQKN